MVDHWGLQVSAMRGVVWRCKWVTYVTAACSRAWRPQCALITPPPQFGVFVHALKMSRSCTFCIMSHDSYHVLYAYWSTHRVLSLPLAMFFIFFFSLFWGTLRYLRGLFRMVNTFATWYLLSVTSWIPPFFCIFQSCPFPPTPPPFFELYYRMPGN